MSNFIIEEGTEGAFSIVSREGTGRIVMVTVPNKGAAEGALRSIRMGYHRGRQDEAAIRAAAFAGMAQSSPLFGAAE